MNLKEFILINKKLTRPVQKVVGNFHCLDFTTKMGFRIDINNEKINDQYNRCLNIDGLEIVIGMDSTLKHQIIPKSVLIIGDGILKDKQPNHISSPWSECFWVPKFLAQPEPLQNRQGWCCTMHRKATHRDLIADYLSKTYKAWFETKNYFCYDGLDVVDIEKFMFRKKIIANEIEDMEQVKNKKFLQHNHHIRRSLRHHVPVFSFGPWHFESLIEIVPETSSKIFFVTEKTVKPIAAGMPFVIASCEKFLYRLRKMGFKTFHPYIDESYDEEPDLNTRIEMMMQSVDLFLQNPENLDRIQEICDHNRQTLKKIRSHSYHNHVRKKLRRFITFD